MRTQSKRERVPGVPGFYRTKRPEGFVYEFRVPGETKWTRVPGCPAEQEAKRWRNRYLGLEDRQRVKPTQTKFGEYGATWIAETPTLKPRTRRLYESQLKLHLSPLHRLRMHEVDVDAIRLVIGRMQDKNKSPNTIRNVLVTLGSIMGAAVDDKLVPINPLTQLGRRARPKVKKARKRILAPIEAAKLIEMSEPAYRPIVAVMLFAGLRISETLGLTWGDVDLQGRTIHVWRQLAYDRADVTIGDLWTTLKGDESDVKERTVEMSELLRVLLVAHRGDRIAHRDDLLFTTSNATPYAQRYIQRAFARIVERVGFNNEPKLTPHQCRHNFATALIASGADVVFVSNQLGHADPAVTLSIYAHEFTAAREAGTGAAAIDRIYGAAMAISS